MALPGGDLLPAHQLAVALDGIVTHCASSAIDPSLLALLGLCNRVRTRLDDGDSTPCLAAADALDASKVRRADSSGQDLALKAMFACLAGGHRRRAEGLSALREALVLEPDAWDLLICQAICLRAEKGANSAELLAPVLVVPGLPPHVREALEAQAEIGVDRWFDPFS